MASIFTFITAVNYFDPINRRRKTELVQNLSFGWIIMQQTMR